MKKLTVEADRRNMQAVQNFVEKELTKDPDCIRSDVLKVHMVIDEIFGNISDYAYDDGTGNVTIAVDIDGPEKTLQLVFSDEGKEYNPLLNEDPDITLPVGKRAIGGLGILMVKNTMDEIRYEYEGGRNILIMRKRIGGQ